MMKNIPFRRTQNIKDGQEYFRTIADFLGYHWDIISLLSSYPLSVRNQAIIKSAQSPPARLTLR